MEPTETILLYMTVGGGEEAERIATALVDERLVACVNLLGGMRSFYRWQGEVANEAEVVMTAKTRADLVQRVSARVAELHSYDCPCIVALPIVGGHRPFIDWIGQETADRRGA